MNKKPFRLGIVLGRFQILHKGHEEIINRGIELCDKFVVYIGSSQESGTEKNPYTYEFRKNVLEKVFGDKIEVRPIPDCGLGNNQYWGKYVIQTVINDFNQKPDLIVSGNEARRESWFNCDDMSSISELIVSKSTVMTSSSDLKEYMFRNDHELWKFFTNEKIHDMYDELREKYLECRMNTDTRSI